MKVEADSSLKPPLECNQDQMTTTFLTNLGVRGMWNFRLALARKQVKTHLSNQSQSSQKIF